MGKWATKAGMRVLIDFHYSDDWADPARQTAPKAWADYKGDPDKTSKALSKFTTESIEKLLDEGVDVGMVQVGNETNNGIAGVEASGDWTSNVGKVYAAGCDAVHEVAKLLGICPPVEMMTPCGFSNSMMSITRSKVNSSKYSRSHIS